MDALARTQSPGKRVLLHVGGGGGCFSKCDVAVYDSTHRGHSAAGRTFAILVPPGQEFTWTFASPEGNQQVWYYFSLVHIKATPRITSKHLCIHAMLAIRLEQCQIR